MKNQPQADLNVGSKQKRHGEHRLIDRETVTAIAALNRNPDGNQLAIDPQNVAEIIDQMHDHAWCKLFKKYRAYLPNAEKEMEKHSLQEEDVLPACIQELAKPVKELAKMQSEEGKLIMVVELSAIESAIQLMEARVSTLFMRKFYKNLPDGIKLLNDAEAYHEEVASRLRMPRRTKAIMQGRKFSAGANKSGSLDAATSEDGATS